MGRSTTTVFSLTELVVPVCNIQTYLFKACTELEEKHCPTERKNLPLTVQWCVTRVFMLHQARHNCGAGRGVWQIVNAHQSKTQAEPGCSIKGREGSRKLKKKKRRRLVNGLAFKQNWILNALPATLLNDQEVNTDVAFRDPALYLLFICKWRCMKIYYLVSIWIRSSK